MFGSVSFTRLPSAGLVVLTVLFLAPLRAAIVRGTVLDDAGVPVSGAAVKSLDLATGLEDSRVTGVDGKFTFGAAPDLTIHEGNGVVLQGMFYLSAEKSPGYRNAVGAALGNPQPTDVELVLTRDASVTGGGAFLGALVGAASFRPAVFPESSLTAGSIITGFGENVGPDQLINASQVPLPEALSDFSLSIKSGGTTYAGYPVYTSKFQFSAIIPGNVPPGPAWVMVTYQGKQSNPLGVFIDSSRPTFFTLNQSGQGSAVVTDTNFDPITFQNSAMPGQTVIPWFTGGGMTPFGADRGGEYDFRAGGVTFDIYLGVDRLPENQVLYFGSSGYAGLGQGAIVIPQNAPLGCAVPLFAVAHVPGDPVSRLSNVVSIPITNDGGPCGDPHSGTLPTGLVEEMGNVGKVDFFSSTTEWSSVYNGAAAAVNRTLFTNRGYSYTDANYSPQNAAGTCAYMWAVPGQPGSGSAWTLTAGKAKLQIPGAYVEATPANSFNATYGWSQDLFDRISDGAGMFATEALGYSYGGLNAVLNEPIDGAYSHESWRYQEKLTEGLGEPYRQNPTQFTFLQTLNAEAAAVVGSPGVALEAAALLANARGSHLLHCYRFPSASPEPNLVDKQHAAANLLSRLAPRKQAAAVKTIGFVWDTANAARQIPKGASGVYYDLTWRATQQFSVPAGLEQLFPLPAP